MDQMVVGAVVLVMTLFLSVLAGVTFYTREH
jgi:hypothetical protein